MSLSSHFLDLPIELKDRIMRQLNVRSLLNLGSVSGIFFFRGDNELSMQKHSDFQATARADKVL